MTQPGTFRDHEAEQRALRRDTARAMLRDAIGNLQNTIDAANGYLILGNDLAALGTLCTVENECADLHAALRLFTNAMRKT